MLRAGRLEIRDSSLRTIVEVVSREPELKLGEGLSSLIAVVLCWGARLRTAGFSWGKWVFLHAVRPLLHTWWGLAAIVGEGWNLVARAAVELRERRWTTGSSV